MASSISSVGSSPHELMIATEESANVRSLWATPARSSELLPTPVGPYRTVSLEASRLATMISRSRSRPKKSNASNGSSSNGARPLYGLNVALALMPGLPSAVAPAPLT